ncbi:hypothetical protein FB480_103407 [Agrobacterium vitis]|nr:hypothetical protein FB480_103407 [Agrobacterium vitis]
MSLVALALSCRGVLLKWLKTFLVNLYGMIGIAGFLLLALLVFEEGVPFLGINGRVANHAASQVEAAKAGLVAQADLDAANAKLTAMTLRLQQAEMLAEQARAIGENIIKKEGQVNDALKASVSADNRVDGARWSASDIEWLSRERQRLGLAGQGGGAKGGG